MYETINIEQVIASSYVSSLLLSSLQLSDNTICEP